MRWLAALAVLALAGRAAAAVPAVTSLEARAIPYDDGRHLHVGWTRAADLPPGTATALFRKPAGTPADPPALAPGAVLTAGDAVGPWTLVALLEAGETEVTDEVLAGTAYLYLAVEVRRDAGKVVEVSAPATVGPRTAEAALVNLPRLAFLVIIVSIGLAIGYYARAIRRSRDVYVRRLPGVDAIEDAIGRSTEMGRPVLYVTGLEEIQNIQTIASLLILGHVAEKTAQYDTELKVANYYPLTMVVAEEVVRQGYANAGRIDAHRPEDVFYITAEQFAFAAGVSGMILRDRPATNIYLGSFYGESLLLAETGFLTGSVQIAGTAELTQLPFFITACDYTLIGEEMYAASAYLTREPTQLANLKAADAFKIAAMVFILAGVVLTTAGLVDLPAKVFP